MKKNNPHNYLPSKKEYGKMRLKYDCSLKNLIHNQHRKIEYIEKGLPENAIISRQPLHFI